MADFGLRIAESLTTSFSLQFRIPYSALRIPHVLTRSGPLVFYPPLVLYVLFSGYGMDIHEFKGWVAAYRKPGLMPVLAHAVVGGKCTWQG